MAEVNQKITTQVDNINEILFLYCINCGNESDKHAKRCEVCGKKDLFKIRSSDKKEIIKQIQEQIDHFKGGIK